MSESIHCPGCCTQVGCIGSQLHIHKAETQLTNPTNEQGVRDRLFELWRDGRSDNDRYNSVNAAEEWLTAYINAEIAKVLKTILKSYPKKNRTMNDTSKLTRADIDRMITELKEVK